MPAIAPIPAAALEAICEILGETDGGLTGTEIGELLRRIGVEALRVRQERDEQKGAPPT